MAKKKKETKRKSSKCIGAGRMFTKPRWFPVERVKCSECGKTFGALIPGNIIPPHTPKRKR